ncbi:MAG: hypothetical protein HRT37_17470 [Alteromonadaceae bacterium]|nr:hypothetical protein [Alteromonadaceae bacterium]
MKSNKLNIALKSVCILLVTLSSSPSIHASEKLEQPVSVEIKIKNYGETADYPICTPYPKCKGIVIKR